LVREARRNLVAIWPVDSFRHEFFGHALLRRSVFVCNSPDTVKQVFIDDAGNFHSKSPQQRHALEPLIGDGLFISDGPVWQDRRQAIVPLTHISRLPELAPIMTSVAAARAALWTARIGEQVDVLSEMAGMTASIICGAIFGSALGAEAAQDLVGAFTEFQAHADQMDLISLFGLPNFLPRLHGSKVRRSAARIQAVLDGLLARILTAPASGEESLVRGMAAMGGALTMEAIRNEASVLFMAGHETTANTLAWAWYLLSQDAETEARLHAELDALGGRAPCYADMPRLRFTRAIIEETLRLFPPVPIQARVAREPRVIRNRKVPAGAVMMIVPWLLHRHRKYWSEPDSFIPDRFMPGASPAPDRYAYVPFSIGPRICTGAAFGLTEAVLCLATLAQHFRLRLRDGWTVMPTCRLSLRPGEILPMRIEARAG
jgi:cytochrome P450